MLVQGIVDQRRLLYKPALQVTGCPFRGVHLSDPKSEVLSGVYCGKFPEYIVKN